MWHLIGCLLLIMLGVVIGITTMCLLQVNKGADEEMKNYNNKRRNDE